MDAAKAAPQSVAASSRLDGAIAAFGMSAALAIVFNTALAWIKDSLPLVNKTMASWTGHHWRTHGLLDIAVFLVFGLFLMQRRVTISGGGLVLLLTVAVLLGGGGLAAWFALF
jgi:hypothetical protein